MSSLSKIVAPGLRVGWMIGAPEVISRCNVAKQTADLCSSPWTQEIAATYLRDVDLQKHIEGISKAYGAKCHTMITALAENAGDLIDFAVPEGGLFIWARLRNGLNADDLLQQAIERKVIFVPGSAFFTDDADNSALRLSYATASQSEIKEGVQRLSKALQAISALAPAA